MQFVGVGAVPPLIMLLMLLVAAAFYVFYLWGLSRLLGKAGFPQQYVAYAALFDIVMAILGRTSWLWYRLWYPPIPMSAFVALMALAFISWPTATKADSEVSSSEEPLPDLRH